MVYTYAAFTLSYLSIPAKPSRTDPSRRTCINEVTDALHADSDENLIGSMLHLETGLWIHVDRESS